MKKIVLLLLIFTTSLPLIAQSVDGIDEGYDFCNDSITFMSDRSECLAIMNSRNTKYIDLNALDVCKEMTFDDGKIECIKIIVNKEFEKRAINSCLDLTFDSDKNECLEDAYFSTGEVEDSFIDISIGGFRISVK